MATASGERLRAWILESERFEGAGARVFGLDAHERLRRGLLRGSVAHIERVAPERGGETCTNPCVVLRDDLFYDERVLLRLLETRDCVLLHRVHPTGPPRAVAASCAGERLPEVVAWMRSPDLKTLPTGLAAVGVDALVPAYDSRLRKSADPFVLSARDAAPRDIENRIFAASYKGITDAVTKWVFPLPARELVRVLARAGVRPNAVTSASYVLAVAVTWLFLEGWLVTGLALAWTMTFLDTVDGKLARCTLTSTRFGNVFDHALDLVHPPFWWTAWALALPGGLAEHGVALAVVLGGYLAGRMLELAFSMSFSIECFAWRRFDGWFRQVIARRNPNLVLLSLGLALGDPAAGFGAVAVWTALCVGICAVRNVQARIASGRGVTIRSWLEEPASGAPIAR